MKCFNAKNHEKEAYYNEVRVNVVPLRFAATNMAGRGTDIKLGEGVLTWWTLCHWYRAPRKPSYR